MSSYMNIFRGKIFGNKCLLVFEMGTSLYDFSTKIYDKLTLIEHTTSNACGLTVITEYEILD